MIKLVSMWRHNPELGAQMSDEHYFQRHTPMALSLLSEIPGFLKYTQNSVVVFHRRGRSQPTVQQPGDGPTVRRSPEFSGLPSRPEHVGVHREGTGRARKGHRWLVDGSGFAEFDSRTFRASVRTHASSE